MMAISHRIAPLAVRADADDIGNVADRRGLGPSAPPIAAPVSLEGPQIPAREPRPFAFPAGRQARTRSTAVLHAVLRLGAYAVSASLPRATALGPGRGAVPRQGWTTAAPPRPSQAGWRDISPGPRSASTVRRSPRRRPSRSSAGEGLRLDRQPVSDASALGLPSFVVRGAELGDRRRAQGDGPN
jgi:hypothetical protein